MRIVNVPLVLLLCFGLLIQGCVVSYDSIIRPNTYEPQVNIKKRPRIALVIPMETAWEERNITSRITFSGIEYTWEEYCVATKPIIHKTNELKQLLSQKFDVGAIFYYSNGIKSKFENGCERNGNIYKLHGLIPLADGSLLFEDKESRQLYDVYDAIDVMPKGYDYYLLINRLDKGQEDYNFFLGFGTLTLLPAVETEDYVYSLSLYDSGGKLMKTWSNEITDHTIIWLPLIVTLGLFSMFHDSHTNNNNELNKYDKQMIDDLLKQCCNGV